MHILLLQECDFMAIKLIIEGNTVYEIDEDCMERQKRGRCYGKREPTGEEEVRSERPDSKK